jgi:protein involved in polysaccharide export with SLBB domain
MITHTCIRIGRSVAATCLLLFCGAAFADTLRGDPALSMEEPASSTPAAPPTVQTTDAATLLAVPPESSSAESRMFGEQLFSGAAPRSYGAGFNPDYSLAIGDRVALRMWGSFSYEAVQPIDPQGNIFLPSVGPIRLAGVANHDLHTVVRTSVRRVYRTNVDVYASLEASQPVRVFVTGFVRAPGQYAGSAGESVLGYLHRAGGVDAERGSYIDIRLLRGGQPRAAFNLYDFLLEGRFDSAQLQDGDTIVVASRSNAVRASGEVFNPYGFEFRDSAAALADIVQLARPKPTATHVSIIRKSGLKQSGEYHRLDQLAGITVQAGDELSVVADRSPSTILVRVDGAVDSSRVLTLPHGARLKDALALIRPTQQAQPAALQLFRQSVKQRQGEMLEMSLRALETQALTARSATREEASLRTQEAALISRFVQQARMVEPRGQVILGKREDVPEILLEDGDILFMPQQSSIVMVHGEVTQPQAISYDSSSSVRDYLRMAGGTTQKLSDARVLLIRQDGTFERGRRSQPRAGDEILVLPEVGSRKVEVTRGITQILYQIAIAAKVALDL